ncbi:MAG TPA: hypothetical protein VJU18_15755 [Vicinamibacteria bacterium]|nr:hypothetical protein [Vicinamibacteria bacterium]
MARTRRFRFVDGREIEAASPMGFFEKLRQGEANAPVDLGRYLDTLQRRGRLIFGVELEVGPPQVDVATRCQIALASLMSHGWIRVDSRPIAPGPRLLLS